MLSVGTFVRTGDTGSATTLQLTWFVPDVLHPAPVAVRRLLIVLVPVTAAKLGTVVDQLLQLAPPSVVYWYSSAVAPAPPVPATKLTLSIWPLHTVATAGIAVITGANGWADTTQLTWLEIDTPQPEPSAVRRLSTIFVPITAAKFGTVVDQILQVDPPSVEERYSSAVTPVPPDPAVVTLIVSAWPEQTATLGLLAITGETGGTSTIQLTLVGAEVVQPGPVAVRRLCIILVPATAAKLGTLADHPLQVPELLVE